MQEVNAPGIISSFVGFEIVISFYSTLMTAKHPHRNYCLAIEDRKNRTKTKI